MMVFLISERRTITPNVCKTCAERMQRTPTYGQNISYVGIRWRYTLWCALVLMPNEPHHKETGFLPMQNKGADQLRGNREADQRLCFRCTDSTIPLLSESKIYGF